MGIGRSRSIRNQAIQLLFWTRRRTESIWSEVNASRNRRARPPVLFGSLKKPDRIACRSYDLMSYGWQAVMYYNIQNTENSISSSVVDILFFLLNNTPYLEGKLSIREDQIESKVTLSIPSHAEQSRNIAFAVVAAAPAALVVLLLLLLPLLPLVLLLMLLPSMLPLLLFSSSDEVQACIAGSHLKLYTPREMRERKREGERGERIRKMKKSDFSNKRKKLFCYLYSRALSAVSWQIYSKTKQLGLEFV